MSGFKAGQEKHVWLALVHHFKECNYKNFADRPSEIKSGSPPSLYPGPLILDLVFYRL